MASENMTGIDAPFPKGGTTNYRTAFSCCAGILNGVARDRSDVPSVGRMILVVCNEESGLVVNRLQVIQTVGRNENGKNDNLRQVTFSTELPL